MYKSIKDEKQSNCLICFSSLHDDISIKSLFSINSKICNKCKEKFKVLNKKEKIEKVDVLFLYEYNSFMKKLIYKYKGCYDYVLKNVFLCNYEKQINKKYKDHIIVYPPSNESEDKERGFNHIEEIAKTLKIKSEKMFYKSSEYKQSSVSFNNRYKVKNYIKIYKNKIKKEQKYLIIDDIFTSGSTLKTIINLLVNNGVNRRNICAIIVAKTAGFVDI